MLFTITINLIFFNLESRLILCCFSPQILHWFNSFWFHFYLIYLFLELIGPWLTGWMLRDEHLIPHISRNISLWLQLSWSIWRNSYLDITMQQRILVPDSQTSQNNRCGCCFWYCLILIFPIQSRTYWGAHLKNWYSWDLDCLNLKITMSVSYLLCAIRIKGDNC